MAKGKVEHGGLLVNLLDNPAYNGYRIYLITHKCGCTQHSATAGSLAQAVINANVNLPNEDWAPVYQNHGEPIEAKLVRG